MRSRLAWPFGSKKPLQAALRGTALRLTPPAAAPLRAGRYFLHASLPAAQNVTVLTIDVQVEGEETVRPGTLDFECPAARRVGPLRAVETYTPVMLMNDAPAIRVTADDIAAEVLAGAAWRLQYRGYSAFYAGLLWRFFRRARAKKESAAMWGGWAAALSMAPASSGFTGRVLDDPDAAGAAVRLPVLLPSLRLIADFSRGGPLPEIDTALLAQARLAGFSALCLPCRWDGARLSLPGPVERFLADATRDFPFFLRRVDGSVAAGADMAGAQGFAAAIAPWLDDPRSLRVGTISGAVLTGAGGAADKDARLPDTPPVLFGRAAHAAIGTALRAAEVRAAPASVFVDLARRDGDGPTLAADRRYGYAWVEALRVAQARHAAPAVPLPAAPRIAVVVHAYYPDVFEDVLALLREIPPAHKLFITTVEARKAAIEKLLAAAGRDYSLRVFANRGRDVLPFFHIHDALRAEGFDVAVKVHTKRSAHRRDGEHWRRTLIEPMLGPGGIERVADAFRRDATLGMVGPDRHLTGFRDNIVANEARVFGLARRLGLTGRDVTHGSFFAGSMFAVRLAALAPLMSLAISEGDFEPEAGQLDGTLAHAIERGFALSVLSCGMRIAGLEDASRRRSLLWNLSG